MKRRMLASFLLVSGFVFFGVGGKQTSTLTLMAEAQAATTDGCDDKQLVCGPPFKGADGQLYEDCYCPLNGLTIRRPAF